MGFLSQVWYYFILFSCDVVFVFFLFVQEDFNEGLYVLVIQLGIFYGLYQFRGISQGIFKISRLMYIYVLDVFVVLIEVIDIYLVLKYIE